MTSRMWLPACKPYGGSLGGWYSTKSAAAIIAREHVPLKGPSLLSTQNKPEGCMCVSFALATPWQPHRLEFCESGAKATAWESTPRWADPACFDKHKLSELEHRPDHDLEEQGWLSQPPALRRDQRQVCSSGADTNPLFLLAHHGPKSKTPSYKLSPVRPSRSHLSPVG